MKKNKIDYKSFSMEELQDVFNGIRFKTQPMRHQLIAYLFALDKELNKVMFWYGIGTGKTKLALDLSFLWDCKKILVVSPKSIIKGWENQITIHTNYSYTKIIGASPEEKIQKTKEESDIYLINYEAIFSMFGYKIKEAGKDKTIRKINLDAINRLSSFDLLICDECHRLKNNDGVTVKFIHHISSIINKTIFLTGSPISKNELDLWAQYWCLDDGKTLGDNFYRFRNKYFFQAGFDWKERKVCPICSKLFGGLKNHLDKNHKYISLLSYQSKYKSLEKKSGELILNRINPITLRFSTDECIDLPDSIYLPRYVDFSSEQIKANKKLLGELQDDIDDGIITEENILSRVSKLAQISGGFIYSEQDTIRFKDNPKLEETLYCVGEILQEEKKVIIFHRFVEEGRMIGEALLKSGIQISELRAEIKNQEEEYRKFKEKEGCRVLIAQPKSGGEGLDLFESRVTIFYSNTYEGATTRPQSEGRTRRKGQTGTCIYIDILIEGSIDEIILESGNNKRILAKKILDFISTAKK